MPNRNFFYAGAAAAALGLMVWAPSAAVAQTQRATAPGPSSGATTSGTITNERGPGMPPVDAHQTTRGTNNHEVFHVLGMSGQIAAPVTPPYNGSATYTTFGGQPENGGPAVLAHSMDGAP